MINFNGTITDQSDQLINNRAFLYGDSVFETLRIIDNKIGFFDKFAGWELVVMDLLKVHKETNRLFPKLPKILLGHSMGS